MAERRGLTVWCFGRPAGTLTAARRELSFDYSPEWETAGMPPLSQSLPLSGDFPNAAARAYFGGLLPEGAPRRQLARRLGVGAGDDFGLLAAIAGDTAGAVSLQPPGTQPAASDGDVRWLSEAELVDVIDELPTRPMHADEDGEYRLSLAGAQDKLPVVVGPDGRIGIPRGETPSTHILKTPIERLYGTVLNEAFCLAFGAALGVGTVTAVPRRVLDREFLLVERYDRSDDDGGATRRLHQEDFCQALAIATAAKYQSDGGPSLAQCFGLLRAASDAPAVDVNALLAVVALNLLVGNHDAHGKNFSLLYEPHTPRARLAPAYDVLSTSVYRRSHGLSRKMAMSVGGVYNPEYLEPRHLDQVIGDAGLALAATRRRLKGFAEAAPDVARRTADRLSDDGWEHPILAEVVEVVRARATLLRELTQTGTGGRRPSSGRRVRIGQEWRLADPDTRGPTVISVLSVASDDEVRGTTRVGGEGPIEHRTWSVADFEAFALIHDPSWPTFLVAAALDIDDPRAETITRIGGELEGARSHTLTADGLGGPETCWQIIAPTEQDALEIVRRRVGRDVAVRAAPRWLDGP